MLIELHENLEKQDIHDLPSRGVVVDNKDPKMLGRVKCEIIGRWPINEKKKLPWCFPLTNFSLGGSMKTSGFSVPEIGTEVVVIFPYNDEYAPFYTGFNQNEVTHQTPLFDEDYPESYGHCDSQMSWVKTNKKQGYHELFNFCGFTARMYEDGNVHVFIPKNLTIYVGEDFYFKIDGKSVTEIHDTCSTVIDGDTVLKVKSNYNIHVLESVYTKTEGDRHSIVNGEYRLTVDGDYNFHVKSNFYSCYDSNYSRIVSGSKSVKTFGNDTFLAGSIDRIVYGNANEYVTQEKNTTVNGNWIGQSIYKKLLFHPLPEIYMGGTLTVTSAEEHDTDSYTDPYA